MRRAVGRALPRSAELKPAERGWLAAAFILLGALLAVRVLGPGRSRPDRLGIRLVAEGVEDRWTMDALRALECDLIQGYLISRPLPAQDIEAQLAAQVRHQLSSGTTRRHEQLNSQRRSIDRARIAV